MLVSDSTRTTLTLLFLSQQHDSASKAEEMLMAMGRLHASGMPNLKPDAFTYTAVIDVSDFEFLLLLLNTL